LVDPGNKAEEKKDLKDFYLKAHIPKESIKTVSIFTQLTSTLGSKQ